MTPPMTVVPCHKAAFQPLGLENDHCCSQISSRGVGDSPVGGWHTADSLS